MWHGGGWGFGFWWIFPLVFGAGWLVLLGLLIWHIRWRYGGGPDALATLRDRFARGEVDAEEFERRRRILAGR